MVKHYCSIFLYSHVLNSVKLRIKIIVNVSFACGTKFCKCYYLVTTYSFVKSRLDLYAAYIHYG